MTSSRDAVRPDAHGVGSNMLSEMVRGPARRVGVGGGVLNELHAKLLQRGEVVLFASNYGGAPSIFAGRVWGAWTDEFLVV